MGHIKALEVKDFKSYKGKQLIGPFKNFTAIIGPNGSGKSNLMEAISFVVGVKTKQLRSDNLKGLIYYRTDRVTSTVGAKDAEVSLIYQPSDSEVDGWDGKDMKFTRKVNQKGVSTYYFNQQQVTWDDYNSHLKTIGVLVKARNFLVFQGDIESIASKSPEDLTTFFEELSGSIELKEEYDRLLSLKNDAEQTQLLNVKMKKTVVREKKQVEQQQKEAELFKEKSKVMGQVQTDHILWQLHLISKDIDASHVAQHEMMDEMASVRNREESITENMMQQRTRLTEVLMEKKRFLKDLKQIKVSLKNVEEQKNHAHNKTVTKEKQKQELQLKIKQIEENLKSISDNIKSLSGQISKVNSAEEQLLNEQLALQSDNESALLNKLQLEELGRLKFEISADTSVLRGELQGLQAAVEAKKDQKASIISSLESGKKLLEGLEVRSNTLLSDNRLVSEEIATLKESIAIDRSRLTDAREHINTLEKKKDKCKDELRQVNSELDQLHMVEDSQKKEAKSMLMLDLLKRSTQGVYGRLVDLIDPLDSQYQLALTSGIGSKYLHSIIVDTFKTALLCQDILDDHRCYGQTILPLDSLRPKAKHENLREKLRHFSTSNAQSFKLAYDLVRFDPSIKKAVDLAVGSTVVCKNIDDARYICFTKNQRCKAVTLQGQVISNNGDMTGGSDSRQMNNSFLQRDMDQLKATQRRLREEIKNLESQLYSESSPYSGESLERKITIEQESLNNKLVIQTRLQEQLKSTGQSVTAQALALEQLKERENMLSKEIETLNSKINVSMEELKRLEDQKLKSFGEKHGIANVKMSEEHTVNERLQLREKISVLTLQKQKLESRLRYFSEAEFDLQQKLLTSKTELSLLNEKMKTLVDEFKTLESKASATQQLLIIAEKNAGDVSTEYDEAQARIKRFNQEKDKIEGEMNSIKQRMDVESSHLFALRTRRHEILDNAILKQIFIPFIEGESPPRMELGENDQDLSALASSQSTNRRSSRLGTVQSESEAPRESQSSSENSTSTINITDSSLRLSQESSAVAIEDEKFVGSINFDEFLAKYDPSYKSKSSNKRKRQLPNESLVEGIDAINCSTEQQRKMVDEAFIKKISTIRVELEMLQPNLRAEDQFKEVSSKLSNAKLTLLDATEEARRIGEDFDAIKTERKLRFGTMFKHVEEQINRIYKDLTRSKLHVFGGTADLELENVDEPWSAGIKFSASPPGKRYRSMDQLSGGEKTVAALALLFAVHSFHPAPFFVMDEIDAALDNVNVAKVCNYIKRNSNNFQCVVISLKEKFYSNAELLIGAYRDQHTNSSGVATLDMSRYT